MSLACGPDDSDDGIARHPKGAVWGNTLADALNITATSRAQLDDLYRALTSHPMVKIVL